MLRRCAPTCWRGQEIRALTPILATRWVWTSPRKQPNARSTRDLNAGARARRTPARSGGGSIGRSRPGRASRSQARGISALSYAALRSAGSESAARRAWRSSSADTPAVLAQSQVSSSASSSGNASFVRVVASIGYLCLNAAQRVPRALVHTDYYESDLSKPLGPGLPARAVEADRSSIRCPLFHAARHAAERRGDLPALETRDALFHGCLL